MRHKYIIVSGLVGVLLALGTLLLLGAARSTSADTVLGGVRFMGADLSGMDRPTVAQKLGAMEKELLSTPVLLKYQDKSWQVHPLSLGASLDIEKIADSALKAGMEGSFWERWLAQSKIKENGVEIMPAVKLDPAVFNKKIDQLTAEIISAPQNAEFRIGKNDTIEIIPGRDGIIVDKEKAQKDLLKVLEDHGSAPVLDLSLIAVRPERTTEAVAAYGIKGLLASFSTRFNPSVTDRTYNIRVAAAALDNLLVPPGEEVSFNKVVGPRSSEAGYKSAKVIVNNQLVDGLGGGVCQVSTTLYNSVLLAGLEVVSRSNHSIPVSYVPPGRDATVAYDTIDFVFRNNTPSHIYIKTFVSGGQATVKIYGNTEYKKNITIKTNPVQTYDFKVVYEPDPTLPKGVEKVKQEGVKGSRIVAQRVVYENGTTRVEPIPGSYYHPMNKIVLVGTGENTGLAANPGELIENPGEQTDNPVPPGSQTDPGGVVTVPGDQTQPPANDPGQNPPAAGGEVSNGGQDGENPDQGGIVPPSNTDTVDPVNEL